MRSGLQFCLTVHVLLIANGSPVPERSTLSMPPMVLEKDCLTLNESIEGSRRGQKGLSAPTC